MKMVWQLGTSSASAVAVRLMSKHVLLRTQAVVVAATATTRLMAVRSFSAAAAPPPPPPPAAAKPAAAKPAAVAAKQPPPKQYSVKDRIIHLTIVDPSGARKQITGLVGKTLHYTFEMHNLDIGPSSSGAAPEILRTQEWIEPTFGEGPTSGYDHVVLAGKGSDTVTRMTSSENEQLQDYWDFDEVFSGSRLASTITLTKAMDGMVVYVPDRLADDVP